MCEPPSHLTAPPHHCNPFTHHPHPPSPRQAVTWHTAHVPPRQAHSRHLAHAPSPCLKIPRSLGLYASHAISQVSIRTRPIRGAASPAVTNILVHREIPLLFARALETRGAAYAIAIIGPTRRIRTMDIHNHMSKDLHTNQDYILHHLHIHIQYPYIPSKLFAILTAFHQQNSKLQNQFPLHPQKFKKIYFHPVAPVATLYPLADQIAGVGDLEIGGLEGDPGDLGSRTRTFAMCGGALVAVSYAHSSGVWGPGSVH